MRIRVPPQALNKQGTVVSVVAEKGAHITLDALDGDGLIALGETVLGLADGPDGTVDGAEDGGGSAPRTLK